jgi:hypothetical protein
VDGKLVVVTTRKEEQIETSVAQSTFRTTNIPYMILALDFLKLFLVLATVAALQAPYLRSSKAINNERCQSRKMANERSSQKDMDRFSFNRIICRNIGTLLVAGLSPTASNAIEFVPASPAFQGTYQDAKEILYTQRIAVDNIANVISNGNLDEAGFKIMQLSAQTRTAGKIVIDTLQEKTSGDSINVLRFLSCQRKLTTLLDYCDDCGLSLQGALKGKLGVTAAAQLKISIIIEETKNAYDDFLGEISSNEKNQML